MDLSISEADNPEPYYWKLQFEVLSSEAIRLTESYIDDDKAKQTSVYLKQ